MLDNVKHECYGGTTREMKGVKGYLKSPEALKNDPKSPQCPSETFDFGVPDAQPLVGTLRAMLPISCPG